MFEIRDVGGELWGESGPDAILVRLRTGKGTSSLVPMDSPADVRLSAAEGQLRCLRLKPAFSNNFVNGTSELVPFPLSSININQLVPFPC